MIDTLRERLGRYRIESSLRHPGDRAQAAVLIPVISVEEPEVVLTLRADALGSHGGEVAWPGGRRDDTDDSLLTTALRETSEEIGLPAEKVEVVGELRPFISKFGLHVTPFVGLVTEPVTLTPSPDELEDIFRVPLKYLLDDPRTETNVISRHGETHNVPVYHYAGFKIWGLTAMILREFLNHGLDAEID
ncbi:MAG: CoA pyrophosphatase [Pseudomonadales bacterium]|nr:CoA pyrophosphatase [Pseudomonadales bacterium]